MRGGGERERRETLGGGGWAYIHCKSVTLNVIINLV